jgi:hypothetical protein
MRFAVDEESRREVAATFDVEDVGFPFGRFGLTRMTKRERVPLKLSRVPARNDRLDRRETLLAERFARGAEHGRRFAARRLGSLCERDDARKKCQRDYDSLLHLTFMLRPT